MQWHFKLALHRDSFIVKLTLHTNSVIKKRFKSTYCTTAVDRMAVALSSQYSTAVAPDLHRVSAKNPQPVRRVLIVYLNKFESGSW